MYVFTYSLKHRLERPPPHTHLHCDHSACQRAVMDISLKLETQDRTTNPEIPPRKAEFPIFTKLRITNLFLEKDTYTTRNGIPRADPLKSLNNF